MHYILYLSIFLISFFPAYLGYQPQYAWIGTMITLLFAAASFFPFLKDTWKAGFLALMTVSLFGYVIEGIGVLTCFPYGCFAYSEQLGTKILGIVPWILLATWPPLVLGVWSNLKKYWGDPSTSFRFTSFRSGWRLSLSWWIFLVLLDLILDPIAVSMGLRSYPGGWPWFGVPWTNFAGWMLSGTIGVAIFQYFLRNNQSSKVYDTGLRLTMSFFVGYAFWKYIVSYT